MFIYSFIITFLLFFVIYNLSALDIQPTNAYKIYDNLFLDEMFTFLQGSAHCSIQANLFFIFSCIVKVEQSHEFSLTEPFHEFEVAKPYQIVYQTSMKTKKKYIYIWNSVKTKSMKNSGLCLCEKVHLLKTTGDAPWLDYGYWNNHQNYIEPLIYSVWFLFIFVSLHRPIPSINLCIINWNQWLHIYEK